MKTPADCMKTISKSRVHFPLNIQKQVVFPTALHKTETNISFPKLHTYTSEASLGKKKVVLKHKLNTKKILCNGSFFKELPHNSHNLSLTI